MPNKRLVSADPQFFAERACEGVNRSGVRRLKAIYFLRFERAS